MKNDSYFFTGMDFCLSPSIITDDFEQKVMSLVDESYLRVLEMHQTSRALSNHIDWIWMESRPIELDRLIGFDRIRGVCLFLIGGNQGCDSGNTKLVLNDIYVLRNR